MDKNIREVKMLKVVILFAIFLGGCSSMVTIPRDNKDALRYSPDIREDNLTFNANYQALVRCWDEKAEKQKINFSNATYTNIYSDLGVAEITVSYDSYYYLFIEVLKVTNDKTTVNAYGMGEIGNSNIPNWLSIMRTCAAK